MKIHIPWSFRLSKVLLLLVAVAATGCGGKGNISGMVRVNGKPLPFGRVSFFCTTGDLQVFSSVVHDGAYAVVEVPTGPTNISVESLRTAPIKFDPKMPNPMAGVRPPGIGPDVEPPDMSHYVPPKYMKLPPDVGDPEKSGFVYTVTKGDQVYDIDVQR